MNLQQNEGDDLAPIAQALTQDTLFGGQLRLTQPAHGHRAGTDAVLLAAVTPPTRGVLVDVGAGVGTVGLRVAQRDRPARTVLLERDSLFAALACRNVVSNELARVAVAQADALSLYERRRAGVVNNEADVVVSNPPFYDAHDSRPSPDPRRRDAHTIQGKLADWLRACLAMLKSGGTLCLIHRAEAIVPLLSALEGTAGAFRLRFVHPRADAPANRLLVVATKGSRAPPSVLPPLVLHKVDGAFTSLAAALHAGEATLPT